MPDRWNDRRDEPWRREPRYGQDRFGRSSRDDDANPYGYRTRSSEGRSFQGHEHDADWDGEYNQPLNEDRYRTGAQHAGPYQRAAPYGQRPGDTTRGAWPAYGDQRAWDRGREAGPYGQRPGQYADFGFGHDVGPARHDDDRRHMRDHDDRRGFLDRAADRVAAFFGADGDEHRGEVRNHRGRGPKGYRRSDQRISDDVHDVLTDDPHLDASEVVVSVVSAEVTLSGVVSDREAKHRAERLVERVSGVEHVQNNLRVGDLQGGRPDQGFNPLTNPGRGFGDNMLDAQAKGETPRDPSSKTS